MSTQVAERPAVPEWTIADRLRKAREYAGYEQGELAGMIGTTRHTISHYETGGTSKRKPMTILLWASACGVDPAWLATGQTEPPPDGSDERDLWQEITESEQICTVVTFPQVRRSAPERYAA